MTDETVDPVPVLPETKRQKGPLPRRLQDRSKYSPHNGKREMARRVRQRNKHFTDISDLIMEQHVELTPEEANKILILAGMKCSVPWCGHWDGSSTENRQDPPATPPVQDPL